MVTAEELGTMCLWEARPGRGTAASQPAWCNIRATLSGCGAVIPGCGRLPARLSVGTVSKVLHLCAASVTPGLFQLQNLWGSTSSLCSRALPLPWNASAACELGVVSRSSRAAGDAVLSACPQLSFLELLPLARAACTADLQRAARAPTIPSRGVSCPRACRVMEDVTYVTHSVCLKIGKARENIL